MKRALAIFFATAALTALLATPAQAAFGLHDMDFTLSEADGTPAMQAGSHPYELNTQFFLNTAFNPELGIPMPEGALKDIAALAAPGFVGNPTAVPRCSALNFILVKNGGGCPNSSALGTTVTTLEEDGKFPAAVYNLTPPPGAVASIGFWTLVVPVEIDFRLNPNPPYNVIAEGRNLQTQVASFFGSELTLWGNPASPAHDGERGSCLGNNNLCPAGIAEKPFLTMPSSCEGPLPATFEAHSWEGDFFKETIFTHDNGEPPAPLGTFGCGGLGFVPEVSAQATTSSADSATGLDFTLSFQDSGLTDPKQRAQSTIKEAEVRMPEGVTLNPSAAEGLSGCTLAQYGAERLDSAPGQGCPAASKVGDVEVETPLLEGELLRGEVFVAAQDENTEGSRFALYLVIRDPELGIFVKQSGKLEPNEKTGQLMTSFKGIPQVPFSQLRFHFRAGPRAPLITPPTCGTYNTVATLTPWSGNAPVSVSAPITVTSGPNGAQCPSGTPPFKPGFEAGSVNNSAGSYSPFDMRFTRQDGEQAITRLAAVLPKGLSGKIAGLAKCPDSAVAAAKAKSGRAELASPSCPQASKVGTTLAGAGVGSSLTYAAGSLYLAGPYKGDPLSFIAISPAVAGPFDLGTVVVRQGLDLDPETAEVHLDSQSADPIPTILEGIPLRLRDVRIHADRPNFTLNPTSCEPKQIKATLFGSFLPAALTDRYQAAGCAALAFKPKLALSLKGGTKRGAHPALKGVLTYPKGTGYANIADAVVTLPHSAFLEQSHIRTVCTRVQFAANNCPAGSIYGKAKATTPLLDETLEGPVYLRSSSHPLPDLVVALHGIVDINLVGRIDSVNAQIRTSFEAAPDAPVSSFTLEMQGGKKGLVVNSTNLCAKANRAKAKLTAQSGKVLTTQPVVGNSCGGKK
jgi:hypothetical protein